LRSIELAFTIWRGAGITPIDYDGDLKESLKHAAPDGFDAVIDTVGHGYVELAIELGIAPERIDRPSSPDGLALCITTDIVYLPCVRAC
jgi:NADPH:quinone reductase